MKIRKSSHPGSRGFTLIEVLLTMAILSSVLLMFVSLLDQTRKSWQYAQANISQYREARFAFDIITKNLGQASLNTYWDQQDADNDFVPEKYVLTSELHFKAMPASELSISGDKPGHAVFFQAPLGIADDPALGHLSNLMNARGYFVLNGSDRDFRPDFVAGPEKIRYRLMEFLPPTEQNMVYIDHQENVDDPEPFDKWFNTPAQLNEYSRPLAENIVTMVISPREPVVDTFSGSGGGSGGGGSASMEDRLAVRRVAPNYDYDSQEEMSATGHPIHNRLPPLVKVTLIAIDEVSASRIDENLGAGFMTQFSGLWRQGASYEDDIETIKTAFNKIQTDDNGVTLSYKIFSTTVPILSSKWSLFEEREVTP